MGSTGNAIARVGDEEDGWTLLELLVGATISLIVVGVAATMLITAVRTQPVTTERAGQVQQGRVLIERISRELRQGQRESVSGATASGLSMVTYVNSNPCGGPSSASAIVCQVTYACSGTVCTRTERNADGSGTPATTQVVSGIRAGQTVFTYDDQVEPTYVGVELSFPADDGGEGITLSDGVSLRNPTGVGA
ncbi:MAG: PilW family protein [Solirubrobacterales bacterium]